MLIKSSLRFDLLLRPDEMLPILFRKYFFEKEVVIRVVLMMGESQINWKKYFTAVLLTSRIFQCCDLNKRFKTTINFSFLG